MLLQSSGAILLTIINPLALIILFTFGIIKFSQGFKGIAYNTILSLFFLTSGTGILIQIIYIVISDYLTDLQYILMGRISGAIILLSLWFPLYFVIVLNKGISKIHKNIPIFLFLPAIFLSISSIFIGEVELNETRFFTFSTDWVIFMIVIALFILIYFFSLAKKLVPRFLKSNIKKRFLVFIFGFLIFTGIFIDIVLLSGGIVSRDIGVYINSIGLIVGSILIYVGIIFRKNDKENTSKIL